MQGILCRACLLPIPFQNLTFEIQRTLFRRFDWMKLSAFRQVDDILPGAAQDFRRFRRVDDSVGGKVPEVLHCQRNAFADPVEHRTSSLFYVTVCHMTRCIIINIPRPSRGFFICGHSPCLLASPEGVCTVWHTRGACYLPPVNGS